MAEAAVEFLLENLKQVLLHHAHLISDAKSQVEDLENDLQLFRAFLMDSSKNQRKDNTVQVLVGEIRDIVHEIEDVIDSYISHATEHSKSRTSYFKKLLSPLNLINEAKKVEKITRKVKRILDRDPDGSSVRDTDRDPKNDQIQELRKAQMVREDNIVGFDGEADNIINYLMQETDELDVISIIGLPGLGKTTLAGKVFRDPRIQFEIPTRIWVFVTQEFRRRDVFLAILSKFISNTEQMKDKSDQEIAQTLRGHLEKARFLIVMDDVWSAEAWSDLKDAFPKMHKTGKILITSRNVEVARQANKSRDPYKLRFLTPDESLLLLQLEVFGKEVFGKNHGPEELIPYGRTIVQKCGGLPLAIVVIGGILVKKSLFGDTITRKNTWRKVSECVPTYLEEDANVESIIALSYNKLPYYLKSCFLYLGIFAEDFEIPVWTLIRLWIAEGFIKEKTGLTLEQTALDNLEELVNRNLVMVDKMSTDGKIKTCRIHDTLRQFCKKESGTQRENFLQELKYSTTEGLKPSGKDLEKCRRLCIHSNIFEFLASPQISGPPHVRSFVCSTNEDPFSLPAENASSIPSAFKLLRVLDAKPVIFLKFPRELARLIHLRYVVLSSNFKVIPEIITELWNLQSLVVLTSSQSLDIKANIWKMLQLRHVKTDASAILPKCGKSTDQSCPKLQTLGAISPQNCNENVFERLRSLRKLGMRGQLVSLLDCKGMDKLENLDKLKLVNDSYSASSSRGRLPRLPEHYRFPPKLKSLTLCATNLEWHNMSTLGKLEHLEVLKLKENAFMGETWNVSTGHFRRLEVLHIERTDLREWVAEANHFPKLTCLVLRNCEDLLVIPYKLSQVPSFQILDLKRVSAGAVAAAQKIAGAKRKREEAEQESDSCLRSKFKLNIAPGDNENEMINLSLTE